jgi:hypothetical protein
MESKIALCFLTYDNLSKAKLWQTFLNSNYNIYIHNKNDFSGEFNKHCITNTINTKWGDLSLVNATLLLFKEACEEKDNEYFILLSDKCIPLYSADEIYNKIKKLDNNIISSYNQHRDRYDSLHDKSFFNKSEFMKQDQWMILKRDTVNFFINNDYTHIFGYNFTIPDEHYFINIMNKYNISYINKKITYVNWNEESDSNKNRETPETYDNLTNNVINTILETKCLFMRKVSPECKLPSYFTPLKF